MAVETIDELYDSVRQVIRQASGVGMIIPANSDKPPPEGVLYGTILLTPIRAYGQPRKVRTTIPSVDPAPTFTWEDISEATISSIELMVSINFRGDGAKQAAHRMMNASFRQAISTYCRDNGIGWRYVSEARNLTGLEQATLEQRYQIDLHLWVETSISDTIMAAAGFSVELYDEDNRLLTTIDGTLGEV